MSNSWWANKLGQQQPRPADLPPMPPSQQPMTRYTPPTPQQPNLPPSSAGPTQCPGCRGNNYAKIGQQVTASGAVPTYRCYDCGYPLVQSGSGLGGANSAPSQGPTQAAKQVPTGGWNPTTIVDRI